MRLVTSSAIALLALLGTSSMASAIPIASISPISSNGSQMYAVYVSSEAGDALSLSKIGPDTIADFFCNGTFGGCAMSRSGDVYDLGLTEPGIIFRLTDWTAANTYTTDALGSDGYAHAMVSQTVAANDAQGIETAYAIYGQGALPLAAAAAIAQLGLQPETVVTFIGWEDRIGGDFDYNDLIFAFTDPPSVDAVAAVPEPGSLAILGAGLLGLFVFRRRKIKA